MAYNHGKAERKWKLWKEKEEKILRDSGVSEDMIEEIRLYDRQAFNSDRRYYERAQETGTYTVFISFWMSWIQKKMGLQTYIMSAWRGLSSLEYSAGVIFRFSSGYTPV